MSEKKRKGLFSWFGKKNKTVDQEHEKSLSVKESPQLETNITAETDIEEEISYSEELIDVNDVDKTLTEEDDLSPLKSETDVVSGENNEETDISTQLMSEREAEPSKEFSDLQAQDITSLEQDEQIEFKEEVSSALLAEQSTELLDEAVEERGASDSSIENVPIEPNDDSSDEINTELNTDTSSVLKEKKGFFARLKAGLLKTKQNIGDGFLSLFSGKKIDDELFESLEEQLLVADVGVETTTKIIKNLTAHASRHELKDANLLYDKLKSEMTEILDKASGSLEIDSHQPFVILMVGVNGVGKTTTIGKLAKQFEQQGKKVMLAAGDTFRAAAVEQLQVWGERNNIPVIAQHTGADSASVIFDAFEAAKARKIDILIADTAGRLQNKSHLMDELKKIVRVLKKQDVNAPHEIMLTLDASTGQNAVSQTKIFNEAVGLTGIVLTKLDGTAKGGVIFSLADQFNIPVRYIGVGESIDDLRAFNAKEFIDALFEQ